MINNLIPTPNSLIKHGYNKVILEIATHEITWHHMSCFRAKTSLSTCRSLSKGGGLTLTTCVLLLYTMNVQWIAGIDISSFGFTKRKFTERKEMKRILHVEKVSYRWLTPQQKTESLALPHLLYCISCEAHSEFHKNTHKC